jgi:MFS transporter, FHS family, L-fucose permease
MVAVGGLWFIPATRIASFWAFLLGVCIIASGLTFLETIANPYTTVLGPKQLAATRLNLAQSCNGVGWIFGRIAGDLFFYGTDAAGKSTGSQTLWIPCAAVAGVVIVLAAVFLFANVPDIRTEDTYHLDDASAETTHSIWKHPISSWPWPLSFSTWPPRPGSSASSSTT